MEGGGTLWTVMCIHKPCLASEADTWSASVDSCGESAMLRLPEDDMVLSCCGDSSREMISAPWSVRALAVSRKCEELTLFQPQTLNRSVLHYSVSTPAAAFNLFKTLL
ncbi:hypothetical protein NL108_010167 [Boleophthalmus pectinirostris]|nr:hypothetical protein NL108_010167 [Boleophthalmus pectinirostris]